MCEFLGTLVHGKAHPFFELVGRMPLAPRILTGVRGQKRRRVVLQSNELWEPKESSLQATQSQFAQFL